MVKEQLLAVNRNYLNIGDYIETMEGIIAKVEKLEYNGVYTDIGLISKNSIKQVYILPLTPQSVNFK